MNYKIYPPSHRRSAPIDMPLSKSIVNRALIINSLARHDIDFQRYDICDDTKAMIEALKSSEGKINVGAAGTAMRFLTAYFSISDGKTVTIDGSERMRNRPIGDLVDALRNIGAEIDYIAKRGFPPLAIKGRKLEGGEVTVPGATSSQFISALMMIGPALEHGLKIHLTGNQVSMPYILMTIMMMLRAGASITFSDNTIAIAHGAYSPLESVDEGDWSAASYMYELAALGGVDDILISNLKRQSMQGDSATSRIFSSMGVGTTFCPDGVTVVAREGKPTSSLNLNLEGQPDLAPAVIVTASMLSIPFHITGLSTLPAKETDRLAALASELRKTGINAVIENNNAMRWNGERIQQSQPVRIATYNDHRMAMAFAPVAIKIPGIIIEDADVVNKSYPKYWEHLKLFGFKLEKC